MSPQSHALVEPTKLLTDDANLAWLLTNPTLEEMQSRFPRVWEDVARDVAAVVESGDLRRLAASASSATRASTRPFERVQAEACRRMTAEVVRRICVGIATGVDGPVRFDRINGWMLQALLFERGLDRKPVPIERFALVWRLARQRRRLMPLVQPQGIYCFYSRELIEALAELIGERSVLEIAAGDGTLSRFLAEAGVSVTATDDHSWSHAVRYPELVRKQDARRALRAEQPAVVLCSWPPAGNKFEREVFATASVQTYVVITTLHEFAAGNWQSYRQQQRFDLHERHDLGRLVLPPEIDPVVLVFQRR